MAVDVRLERTEKTPWGFRLIGGADYDIPLTIAKVQPSSLAEAAGLRVGDELAEIDGVPATSMTHDAAYGHVTRAGDALSLRVARGHPTKMPVSEFQPIPMQDFAPLSQPYEVPNDRSRTASPFVLPAKPYRPFSTEPVPDIPPLEDPIRLNPDYHDEFVSVEDDDYLPETRFKLPISEQYVPDGKKKKKNFSKKGVDTTSQHLTTDIESVEYMEKMRREIDINEIEETASYVVGESIDKVLVVTEEIKKEFNNAMQEVTTSNSVKETSMIEKLNVEESNITSELEISNAKKEVIDVEVSYKADEITNHTINESNALKFVTNHEQTNTVKENEINRLQNVSNETKIHDDLSSQSINIKENSVKNPEFKEKNNVNKTLEELHNTELKSEEITQVSVNISKGVNSRKAKINNTHDDTFKALSSQDNQKTQTSERTSKKISTSNLLAEQRAYTLGLQTIPNIRGHVHSSYHYDLLLKTFFIHLTDVMVALSRFILAEPLANRKCETSLREQETKITNDVIKQETIDVKTKDRIVENYDIQGSTSKYETELVEMETEKESIEKKKLSGSKMAQMSSRKPIELTEKMDAVISEFEEKSQIETVQRLEVSRDRRSRSRSVIQEEVAKESDPLEWLEKHSQIEKFESNMEVNSAEKSQTVTNLLKTEGVNSVEFKKVEENKKVNEENSISKHDPNKIIYVATVEAHVYTNPDAIIEDMVDISKETVIQSVESAEMNNIIESNLMVCEAEVSQEVLAEEERSAINKEESYQSIKEISLDSENIQSYESVTVNADEIGQKEAVEEIKEEVTVEINQDYKEKSIEFRAVSDITTLEDVDVENVQSINVKEELVETIEKGTESPHELVSSVEQVVELEKTSEIHTEETLLAIEERESIEKTEIQESTFTAKLSSLKAETAEPRRKLSLRIENVDSQQNIVTPASVESDENDSTPTPSSVPPTPLTDEYVFRLEIPLPKSRSTTPAPREVTPPQEEDDHEDPNIVKKKLIPHIEVTIESIVYDKPLDSPTSPKGESTLKRSFEMQTHDGAVEQEDLLEIERKSSLLASAIDDTIKSIEMYKEEVVGMQNISKESISTGIKERKKLEFEEIITTEIESAVEDSSPLRITETAARDETRNGIDDSIESKSLTADVENTIKDIRENTIVEMNSQTNLESTEKRLAVLNQSETVVNVDNDLSTSTNDSVGAKTANILTESSKKCYQNSKTDEDVAVKETLSNESETISKRSEVLETNEQTSKYLGREVQMTARMEGQVTGVRQSMSDGVTSSGITQEVLGTTRGIVDGIISEGLIDEEVANLGKPGMTEDEIAELISGESEMLREAHVMGLQRVLASHMNRKDDDDSSVDFKKIKPTIDSLKDSEVLKALNEDLTKTKAEKKAEERKWTTFLQRPKRPVPRARFGYYRNISNDEDEPEETYKVKIIKQPKPKVAPDYKPQDFETGPLPWEERAAKEPPPPPVPREDPILVPEEVPQYLEAVDPLPESKLPDLEDTGIPLPPEKEPEILEKAEQELETVEENREETPAAGLEENEEELILEKTVEESEEVVEEMEQTKLTDQILKNIQSMVDPSAPLDQQLAQMRAQLAALSALPGVIQHTLELVTERLTALTAQDLTSSSTSEKHHSLQSSENIEVMEWNYVHHQEHRDEERQHEESSREIVKNGVGEETTRSSSHEVEYSSRVEAKEEIRSHVETAILAEEQINEKQKVEQKEFSRLEQESRQAKQRPAPRSSKPKPVFGPLSPSERPLVLPGGRRWRTPKDAFNDEFIAETLAAQAEIIQGKAKGVAYESALLAYDERINFMKYEKPPVSLDHLKHSEVYKVVHETDDAPPRRVELLTPAVAECDYREKCRSVTPSRDGRRPDAPRPTQP